MTIEALITGKLYGTAQRRTASATGKAFVTAKVRAAAGEADSVFVNVVAFSESAGSALLALGDGDSLALAGTLKPGAWTDRDGNARPSLDMVAAQVLTLYALKRRRAAAQADDEPGQRDADRQPQARTQRQPTRPGIRPPADWDAGQALADAPNDPF